MKKSQPDSMQEATFSMKYEGIHKDFRTDKLIQKDSLSETFSTEY